LYTMVSTKLPKFRGSKLGTGIGPDAFKVDVFKIGRRNAIGGYCFIALTTAFEAFELLLARPYNRENREKASTTNR
jgi:hypothetical protein